MRVEVDLNPSESCSVRDPDHFDLHANPKAIDLVETAQRFPALRSVLANLNSSDSIFSTFASKTWSRTENGANPCAFGSRVDLIFLREDHNFGAGPHESLARKLADLLMRETGEALRAELQVGHAEFGEERGFCLRITLEARGATAEQAQLRWGLGLSRVQQALLFAARPLRRELGIES
jgi:hypothetical protein